MKQNFVMKLLISAGLIAAAGCTAPSFHPLSLKNELQYTQYVKEKICCGQRMVEALSE